MKILVINIKFLGDLIVSTPGLSALRKKYPDAEIVFMLRKGFEDVLENNPNIDRIISFDPELKTKSGKKSFWEGIKFILQIRKEKFDTVILLHPGDRITLLAFLSGAKTRIAPLKQSLSFLVNKKVEVKEDSISYLDYYNTIFQKIGINEIKDETKFYIDKESELWADNFLQENYSAPNDLICIHPGASEPTKMWKAENFALLINRLKKIGNEILLIGGPQDENICKKIISFCDDKLIYYQSTNISKTAALLKLCKLFITHDTGTRHLSVALNVPTLALIPDDNLHYWNFYENKKHYHTIIGKRHISDNESFLDNIDVDKVLEKINFILENEQQ